LQELQTEDDKLHSWVAVADWLLISANTIALFVVVSLLIVQQIRLPRAACAAACVLLAGYVFAILAHYRLIFGAKQKYVVHPQTRQTATAEKVISAISVAAAIAAFYMSYV
jgi:hypothetical protein